MPISTLRAWEAAQEADEQLAAEQERREELERDYRRLEAHAEMLETQVSELRELQARQELHDAIFMLIVVGICLALLLFASWGCAPAEAEESDAASVPPVIVDASDQKAQERRSHEVEAVEAGKLDSDGNPIDGEKAIVARLREYVQAKRDEAAAIAAESEPEAEQAPEYEPEEYVPQEAYYGGYSGGSTATTLSDLLNGQGRAVDDNGTNYTYYYDCLGDLDIPGEHKDENGVSYDADGYIVVASSDHEKGTVLDTPYGAARVWDTGCASGTVDIYAG